MTAGSRKLHRAESDLGNPEKEESGAGTHVFRSIWTRRDRGRKERLACGGWFVGEGRSGRGGNEDIRERGGVSRGEGMGEGKGGYGK